MKFYTLIENKKKADTTLIAEHGISFYFECKGKRILFDTGASGAFIDNAEQLGIDISKVDLCIISHSHSDHIGGLKRFLSINDHAKVYMKKSIIGDFYTKHIFKYIKCSIDNSIFKQYSDRIVLIENDDEIYKGVIITNIKKYRRIPSFSKLLYKKQNGELIRDDLSHELFITVKTEQGVIVITGCSHLGILNILMTAKEKFGRIYGVIGGFHLACGPWWKKEPNSEILAIANYFKNNNIDYIYTGHCTGVKPTRKLKILANAKDIYTGDVIEI